MVLSYQKFDWIFNSEIVETILVDLLIQAVLGDLGTRQCPDMRETLKALVTKTSLMCKND